MNKKAIILTTSLLTIAAFFMLAQPAQAFWPFGSGNKTEQSANGFPSIIQKLIDKFNLNPEEVTQVLDETRKEHQQQAQADFEEKLNEAVGNSRITEDQKNKILAKHEEMKNSKENWENLSPEERKEKAKTQQEELKAWAEQNGIDLKDFFLGQNKGARGGFKSDFGLRNK